MRRGAPQKRRDSFVARLQKRLFLLHLVGLDLALQLVDRVLAVGVTLSKVGQTTAPGDVRFDGPLEVFQHHGQREKLRPVQQLAVLLSQPLTRRLQT